jgi:DNA-directed RNA polymerase subunit RPC12/RpoP
MVFFGALVAVLTGDGSGESETDDLPQFCANCGAELDYELEDATDSDDGEYGVDYCSFCGAPLPVGTDPAAERDDSLDSATERTNCPDCGVLNDVNRTECRHCHSTF